MNAPAEQKSAEKVVVRRTINASRERLFDAWTQPELMQQWFFPGNWRAVSSNDLRVGGTYRHEMISDGSRGECSETANADAGDSYIHHGEYLEISRPEKLVFTWNSPAVSNTVVTVEFLSVATGTEIVVTHEFLPTEQAREEHNNGWNGCFDSLLRFIVK